MTQTVYVRFAEDGKVYKYESSGLNLDAGDPVIAETSKGLELGYITQMKGESQENLSSKKIKKIIRKADRGDLSRWENNRNKKREAFAICEEKIKKHKMDMKLIDVDYAFDGSKIVFHFTADGRVDFRDLVKDLAAVFKTRIELRQIGVRDEARKIGGLGPCGRPCCCNAFLDDFQPVSIKMAKEQNLSLSPTKISGLCGRLMCCLNYENEFYKDMRKKIPPVGSVVLIPGGEAEVAECNGLKETVKVKVQLPDGSYDLQTFPLNEISRKNKMNSKNNHDTYSQETPDTPDEIESEA